MIARLFSRFIFWTASLFAPDLWRAFYQNFVAPIFCEPGAPAEDEGRLRPTRRPS
jgi:hypothetical protein